MVFNYHFHLSRLLSLYHSRIFYPFNFSRNFFTSTWFSSLPFHLIVLCHCGLLIFWSSNWGTLSSIFFFLFFSSRDLFHRDIFFFLSSRVWFCSLFFCEFLFLWRRRASVSLSFFIERVSLSLTLSLSIFVERASWEFFSILLFLSLGRPFYLFLSLEWPLYVFFSLERAFLSLFLSLFFHLEF